MSIIIWEVTVQDTITDKIYRTGYKYDHSGMADEVDSVVDGVGGVEGALSSGLLEEIEDNKENNNA